MVRLQQELKNKYQDLKIKVEEYNQPIIYKQLRLEYQNSLEKKDEYDIRALRALRENAKWQKKYFAGQMLNGLVYSILGGTAMVVTELTIGSHHQEISDYISTYITNDEMTKYAIWSSVNSVYNGILWLEAALTFGALAHTAKKLSLFHDCHNMEENLEARIKDQYRSKDFPLQNKQVF